MRPHTAYQVKDGPRSGHLFYYAFGHRRPFLQAQDLQLLPEPRFDPIDAAAAFSLPTGPFMPTKRAALESALKGADTDHIREKLCSVLAGHGYEIGAGERPTAVPAACEVTYIDKFTFEEAQDGSFANKAPDNLVRVSLYEEMEDLKSIPDASADFFIGCHVIEHVPNVIRALRTVTKKLKAGGYIVLVIPDKRHMFDHRRPTTPLQHFIADDLAEKTPVLEHYFERERFTVQNENWIEVGLESWRTGKDRHMHTFTPETTKELMAYCAKQLEWGSVEVLTPEQEQALAEIYVRIRI